LVLASQGKWDQAAANLRRALELNPTFTRARLRLGDALGHLGRWREAAACYERVLQDAPRHEEARAKLKQARRRLRGGQGASLNSPT
jgi:tetratricopeptide (TPR) repeat protein